MKQSAVDFAQASEGPNPVGNQTAPDKTTRKSI